MRQKHLKRTYKALYMMQFVFTGSDRRIMIGHSKIDYIDDAVITAAGKEYKRDSMGEIIPVQNDISCVALKVPYLCDTPTDGLANKAIDYIKEKGPLNISSWYFCNECMLRIKNVMNEDDAIGFKILAIFISNIKGNGIENARVVLDKNTLCEDLGIPVKDLWKYFDRQLQANNIYNWHFEYSLVKGKRKESHQLVTDAKSTEGKIEVCFNANLMLDLRKYARFFESQMESIKA